MSESDLGKALEDFQNFRDSANLYIKALEQHIRDLQAQLDMKK